MKVSAVICAYNEEKTVSGVINAAIKSELIYEVIVINDGSTDNTAEELKQHKHELGIRFIDLPKNMGKGYAMATGVEYATGEVIVFLDADITGLSNKHISSMVWPVLNGKTDMVLGQPSETYIHNSINPLKVFTGERVLLKSDLSLFLDEIKDSRFGVETYINLYYGANGKRIKYVKLKNLFHPIKFQKVTFFKAIGQYISECKEIISTIIRNHKLVIKYLLKFKFKPTTI
jgi:glycosyltransferase involved in cell wall biosynthesis